MTDSADSLLRDAERYRWLRGRSEFQDGEPFIARLHNGVISAWIDGPADAAIDANLSRSEASKEDVDVENVMRLEKIAEEHARFEASKEQRENAALRGREQSALNKSMQEPHKVGTGDPTFSHPSKERLQTALVLLRAAKCPSCDGSGSYEQGGEEMLCQWCNELNTLLAPVASKEQPHDD